MTIKLMQMNLRALSDYLILLHSMTAIAFISFFCIPSIVLAEFRYVKPSAEIPLRSGKGQEYRILAVIQDGNQIELLKEEGAWAMVRTSDNKEGWMPKRYLSTSPPLKDIVASLKTERDRLKKHVTDISEQLDKALKARNQYEQDFESLHSGQRSDQKEL